MRDIIVVLDRAADIVQVEVDKLQIQQVARKFRRNGTAAVRAVDRAGVYTLLRRTALFDEGDRDIAMIDRGRGVSNEVAGAAASACNRTKIPPRGQDSHYHAI